MAFLIFLLLPPEVSAPPSELLPTSQPLVSPPTPLSPSSLLFLLLLEVLFVQIQKENNETWITLIYTIDLLKWISLVEWMLMTQYLFLREGQTLSECWFMSVRETSDIVSFLYLWVHIWGVNQLVWTEKKMCVYVCMHMCVFSFSPSSVFFFVWFIYLFIFLAWNFLCRPGRPGRLAWLRDLPASPSQVLGIKVCATILSWIKNLFKILSVFNIYRVYFCHYSLHAIG